MAAACGGFSLTISVDTATNTTKPPFLHEWRSGSKQMTVASIRHLSRPRRPDVISAPLLASYVGAGIRGRRVPVCDRCPQTWLDVARRGRRVQRRHLTTNTRRACSRVKRREEGEAVGWLYLFSNWREYDFYVGLED